MSTTSASSRKDLDGLAAGVSIVTGGTSGIGLAIVRAFLREGGTVVIAGIDSETGKQLAADFERAGQCAFFVHADVTSEEDVRCLIQSTYDRFGRLDTLVNNAGINAPDKRYTADVDIADWQRIIDVNLTGALLGTRYAIPKMLENGGGALINIASVLGLRGAVGEVAYSVSKAGLMQLTQTVALEYAKKGIRANCVCPASFRPK